jgi:hypothetical protein
VTYALKETIVQKTHQPKLLVLKGTFALQEHQKSFNLHVEQASLEMQLGENSGMMFVKCVQLQSIVSNHQLLELLVH